MVVITSHKWGNQNQKGNMMSKRLELLKRKHKGKSKISSYKRLFDAFEFQTWLELEKTDFILNKIKLYNKDYKSEFVAEGSSFLDSDLLRESFMKIDASSTSYIFTDDYIYCGSFLVNSKEAFQHIFRIALTDSSNTCFLLEKSFKYFFTVNYYDKQHNDFPEMFDIQRSDLLQSDES